MTGPGLTVDSVRDCLEGAMPAVIATCSDDGTPNVSYLSQVHYCDGQHVALTYQFFNKTRQNVLANRRAIVQLVDPGTAAQYRMRLNYVRTEDSGPLFESMKAKLAGIASHSGMQDVFRLLGADVYEVLEITRVPGAVAPRTAEPKGLLPATRRIVDRMSLCSELSDLFDATLVALQAHLRIEHAMVLLLDETGRGLYTVASIGYAASGVGSEVAIGQGVIGVAARERTPIRISHATSDYAYARAARDSAISSGMEWSDLTEIPFPGLEEPHSQLAVPIGLGQRLLGVLFVESADDMRFGYDEEDALTVVARALGATILAIQQMTPAGEERSAARRGTAARGTPATIRHYPADDSVFVEDAYLIKGVAGAILWKLVRDHVEHGRTEFSNRELRLAPELRLPEAVENLEARLILLQRRLDERCGFIRIEKTARGRFRLVVARPLVLEPSVGSPGASLAKV